MFFNRDSENFNADIFDKPGEPVQFRLASPVPKDKPVARTIACLWCHRRVKNNWEAQWYHVQKYHREQWIVSSLMKLCKHFFRV